MLHFAVAGLVFASGLVPAVLPTIGGAERLIDGAFVARRIVVPAGCRRAVCVHLSGLAGDKPVAVEVVSSDPGVARAVRGATVEPGTSLAFVRIVGVAAGVCELRLAGSDAPPAIVEVVGQATASLPEITGPANGAVVWGAFTVSVSLTDLEEPSRGRQGEVALRLSDGRLLKPQKEDPGALGPTRRALFVVDAAEVRSATLELEPVWISPAGDEHAGRPVEVRVVHPRAEELIKGEAEGEYDITRPERFKRGLTRGSTGRDKDASGERYLNNAGSEPAFCFPVTVEADAWYQVMLTARGTLAGGAYPTIGLVIDGAQYAATNARVPDTEWRRFAVGVPVRLTAGERILTPYFENDFYVHDKADRNLAIDCIEVVRVADGAAPGGGGEGGGGMMMGMRGGAMAGGPSMKGEGGSGGAMMSAMSASRRTGAGPAALDPWGLEMRPVRVAFSRPFDGETAAGELVVEGVCSWERDGIAPMVTLYVNGVPAGSQRSAAPRFLIDPAAWRAEENTVQLVGVGPGGVADRTTAQTVRRGGPAPREGAAALRYLRWTIHEETWSEVVGKSLTTDKGPPERRAVGFMSNAEALLELPADLEGRFEVLVESYGQEFDGPPLLTGTLVTPDGRQLIGEAPVQGWWNARRLGSVELKPGAKQIGVSFNNDKYEANKGDRNVWFQALVLHEAAPADAAPPTAAVVYPVAGATVGIADAVVASFADDRGVARVDLLIDGAWVGVGREVGGRTSPVLLPLVTRGLAEGAHTLAVRVTDTAGVHTDSAPVEVRVSHEPAGELRAYDRAVRLLNRLGFGPEPEELAAVLLRGEETWLRGALRAPGDSAGEMAALGLGLARFPNARSEYETVRRPITHAMLTPNSVRARFVLWAENHFSTWARKTEGERKWREHVAFSELGAASFFELLLASATSPAMLRYLDQEQSYAGRLNENYAREVMELHTLGVDAGYSQEDVTNLARLLTGWTTAREGDGMSAGEMRTWAFTYDPSLGDGRATRILGVAFDEASPEERYDRVRFALEVLAAHPSTSRFVCRKLAEHYVSVPAPEGLVEDLAARFRETGGDMTEVMVALSRHPAYTRVDLPDRLAHPLQYALRIARTTGHVNPWQVGDFLQRSGNGMFDRSTPDGYPEEDAAYVDSNAMIQRWRLAQDSVWALVTLVPEPMRYGEWPADTAEGAAWAQRVVDHISVGLTGRVLGEESNRAAIGVVLESRGPKQDRALRVATFIAQLPEASLR